MSWIYSFWLQKVNIHSKFLFFKPSDQMSEYIEYLFYIKEPDFKYDFGIIFGRNHHD